MKIRINENKFNNTFNNLMSKYEDMEPIVRWYEYYDNFKWKDMESINFYYDPEVDFEGDYWVFQYQTNLEGDDDPKKFPRLVCEIGVFRNFKSMFGPFFNDLMKEWFESNYDLSVTSVIVG